MDSVTGALAGKIVSVTGDVSAESAEGSRILSIDSPIYQNDTLITDQGEQVEVLFGDGTKLSVGENSNISVDSYVYDPSAPEASTLLLEAVQGTFRTITGQITEQNPENFTIKSPLATLGIRGTTVLSHITPEHEIHGPEFIEEGKSFVLTDNFGNIRFITDYVPVKVIDVRPDEPAGFQRILTQDEFLHAAIDQVGNKPGRHRRYNPTHDDGADLDPLDGVYTDTNSRKTYNRTNN